MANRKVYLRHLFKFDLTYKQEVVRRLEMTVDVAIKQQGYILQFWKDAALYGIDEAILYVRNGDYGDADMIQREWEKLQVVIEHVETGKGKHD